MERGERSCLSVILAAGKGTRMKSALPKVLHEVAGLPMLQHVVATARNAGSDRLAIVVGHGAERLRENLDPDTETYLQAEQLGTGHAVLAARDAIAVGADDVLVLFGDTPLVSEATLERARLALANDDVAIAVVGFEPQDPTGYGRLIVEAGELVAIREHRDASEAEREIRLCNGGIMAFDGRRMLSILDEIGNASGEYYLTDAIEAARAKELTCRTIIAPAEDVLGVNDRLQLAEAEAIWQRRRREELLRSGVSMAAPETVHLSHDTRIAPDARIEPFVVFGPGVEIAANATILSHSRLEGTTVASGATVGPFARLRPGASIGENAKVGNFCEIKGAEIAAGAKVNHLSYIGDALVGGGANVGAGTITCNYDGANKHRTEIGAGAFVGSNTALVAPIAIGKGAYIASGSTITKDVDADALAFGRARQAVRPGGGKALRERNAAEKVKRSASRDE